MKDVTVHYRVVRSGALGGVAAGFDAGEAFVGRCSDTMRLVVNITYFASALYILIAGVFSQGCMSVCSMTRRHTSTPIGDTSGGRSNRTVQSIPFCVGAAARGDDRAVEPPLAGRAQPAGLYLSLVEV